MRSGAVSVAISFRTCARASSSPLPVSIVNWARRRFSASGTCLAFMAESRSGVMPGRAITRAFCTDSGAETTATASTCASPPVSNSSGTSITTRRAPSASACRQESFAGLAHQRMHDALEPFQRLGVAEHAVREAAPVDRARPAPSRETPPRLAARPRRDKGHAPPHPRRTPGCPPSRNIAAGGGLAHPDRARQAENEHRC